MFAFGIFIVFVGALALLGGVLQKMRAGRVGKTPFAPPSQIAQNGKGIADPKGSISTEGQVRHGQLLTSPVTNTQCLFYELKLEAKWKVGGTENKHTLLSQREAAPFYVADANGHVAVTLDPEHSTDYDVTVPFNEKKFSRGLLGSMTAKPIEVTPAFSIPGQLHYTVGGRQYEVPSTADFFVTERVLELSPFFHVNGKLQDDGSIGAPKWTSLMVKKESRDVLLAKATSMAKKLFIGGGAGAGLGAIVTVIAMLTASPAPAKATLTSATSSVAASTDSDTDTDTDTDTGIDSDSDSDNDEDTADRKPTAAKTSGPRVTAAAVGKTAPAAVGKTAPAAVGKAAPAATVVGKAVPVAALPAAAVGRAAPAAAAGKAAAAPKR